MSWVPRKYFLCDVKYSSNAVGIDVITETERKIQLPRPVAKGKCKSFDA